MFKSTGDLQQTLTTLLRYKPNTIMAGWLLLASGFLFALFNFCFHSSLALQCQSIQQVKHSNLRKVIHYLQKVGNYC